MGIKKAAVSGGMGIVFFFMFASYALAFWFGAKLVREDYYESHGYTAGRMLIVSGIVINCQICLIKLVFKYVLKITIGETVNAICQ